MAIRFFLRRAKILAILLVLAFFQPLTPARAATKLYFRNTSEVNPSESMPNDSASTDTFLGGTWIGRMMTTSQGSTVETESQSISNGDNGKYKMVSFVSDTLNAQTIGTGTWTIHVHGKETNNKNNVWVRATVYVWTAADAKGAVIFAPTDGASEYTTSDGGVDVSFTTSATTDVNASDKLVCEVEINVKSATAGGTASLYWGGSGTTDDSYLLAPVDLGGPNIPTLDYPLLLLAVAFFVFTAVKRGTLRLGRVAA